MKGIEGVVGKEVSRLESTSSTIGTWRESTTSNRSRLTHSLITTPVWFGSITSKILELITCWLVINGCKIEKGKRSERKRRKPSGQKRKEESGQSKQRGPVDSQRVRPGPEGLNRCRNLQTAPYFAEKKHQIPTLEETHVNVSEGRFLIEQIVLVKFDCFSNVDKGWSFF